MKPQSTLVFESMTRTIYRNDRKCMMYPAEEAQRMRYVSTVLVYTVSYVDCLIVDLTFSFFSTTLQQTDTHTQKETQDSRILFSFSLSLAVVR